MKKSRFNLRLVSQILFFLLIAVITVSHGLAEKGVDVANVPSSSIHSVCPFGGVVSIYRFVTAGNYVQKIHESSFVLMVLVFIAALLFGPVFCGWICPFGSFQEWLGKIGKKIFKRRYNSFIGGKLDKYLGLARYLVLIWVVYVTAISAKLVFAEYDPYNALFSFWTSEAQIAGIIVLVAVIVATMFVERPWCKYACPYGALLGLTNLVRPISIRRNADTCISCGKCDRVCPMNINVSSVKNVRDVRCISCLECTSEAACPVKDTVNMAVKVSGR